MKNHLRRSFLPGVVSIKDLPRGLLHRTIRQIINAQEQCVTDLLAGQKVLIKEIASILVDEEKISGELLREKITVARDEPRQAVL